MTVDRGRVTEGSEMRVERWQMTGVVTGMSEMT